jgi:hypothetical protein
VKTLLLILCLALSACGFRPVPPRPRENPPEATAFAHVVVATVSHAADGAPLVRDPQGRFAKWYWQAGRLHVPEGIRADELAFALAQSPTGEP